MSVDSNIARRWHRLADEYAVLAEELAAAEGGRAPLLRTPMQQQQQPQQQQQQQQQQPQQQQQQPQQQQQQPAKREEG